MALPKIVFPLIREQMKAAEETAADISRLLGVSYTTALHKLSGKRVFTIPEGQRLSRHYGISVEELFKTAG